MLFGFFLFGNLDTFCLSVRELHIIQWLAIHHGFGQTTCGKDGEKSRDAVPCRSVADLDVGDASSTENLYGDGNQDGQKDYRQQNQCCFDDAPRSEELDFDGNGTLACPRSARPQLPAAKRIR